MAVSTYSGTEQYNFDIVKKFAVMSLVWAVVGMFVGVYLTAIFRNPVFTSISAA